jgi:carbamoylphosphate synthase small subunit
MKQLKVCVIHDCLGAGRMFREKGWLVVNSVDETCDLVCLTGGSDIHPKLYNEPLHPTTHPSTYRDEEDYAAMDLAATFGIPVFGICRGAQILNVYNGGSLYQDVSGHSGGNHLLFDTEGKPFVTATSLHHQALIPPVGALVIATAPCIAGVRFIDGGFKVCSNIDLPEAVLFFEEHHKVSGFAIQGHPEMSSNEGYIDYTFKVINELVGG